MSFTIGTNQGGGEYYHPLSIEELPRHKHSVLHYYGTDTGYVPANSMANSIAVRTDQNGISNTGGTFTDRRSGSASNVYKDSALLSYTGENHHHYNIQPYFIVYFWRRIN